MAAIDELGKQFFNKNVGFNLFDEQFNDFPSTTLAPPNTGMFDAALVAILPPGVRRSSSDSVFPLQNGTPLLYQGAKFSSFEALSAAVDQYSRQNGVKLFRSDSRTLRSAPNRANPIIPQLAPVELVYYSLTYSCVFAGKSFKNFGQSKQPCRFVVRVNITRDYQQLEVTKLGDPGEHNHDRNGVPVCPSAGGPVTKRRVSANKTSQQGGGSSSSGGGGGRGGEGRDSASSQPVHLNHLMRTLHLFQQRNLFCDTSILTKDGMLYAHSVVLAAVSPALYHALNSKPYVNRQPNMIDLSEYDTRLVTLMVEFFYTGRLCMTNAAMLREVCARLGVILEKDDGGLFEGETPPDNSSVDNISDLGLDDLGLGLGIEGFDLLNADDFEGIAPDTFVLPSDFCPSPNNRSACGSKMDEIVGMPSELSIRDVIDQVLPMSVRGKDPHKAPEGMMSSSGLVCLNKGAGEISVLQSSTSTRQMSMNKASSAVSVITSKADVIGSSVVSSVESGQGAELLPCGDSRTNSSCTASTNESAVTSPEGSAAGGVARKDGPKRKKLGEQTFDAFIRTLNKQLRYPCSSCCRVFRYEPALNAHRWSHWSSDSAGSGSRGPFACDDCGETVKDRTELRSHSWSAHSRPLVAPHVCTVCGRRFLFRSRLWRHMTSHTRVGAQKGMHICAACDRWYNTRDFLAEHLATHSAQRRSICGACGKVFLTHTALVSHKRSHHSRRPGVACQETVKRYGCRQCTQRFDTGASAFVHGRRHANHRSVSSPPTAEVDCDVDLNTDRLTDRVDTDEKVGMEEMLDSEGLSKADEKNITIGLDVKIDESTETVFDVLNTTASDVKIDESSETDTHGSEKEVFEATNSEGTDKTDLLLKSTEESAKVALADSAIADETTGDFMGTVASDSGVVSNVSGEVRDASGEVSDVSREVSNVSGVLSDVSGEVRDVSGVVGDVSGEVSDVKSAEIANVYDLGLCEKNNSEEVELT